MAPSSPPEPARTRQRGSLLDLLATLEPINEEFPEIEDPPPEPLDDLFAWWTEEDQALPELGGNTGP